MPERQVTLKLGGAYLIPVGRPFHPKLRALIDYDGAGVYAIFTADAEALYVGESHALGRSRLYKTITRHFFHWGLNPHTDAQGRRRGGTTYPRSSLVAWAKCRPEDAAEAQYQAIAQLEPRDNVFDGSTIPPF